MKETTTIIKPDFPDDIEKLMLSRGLDRLVLANKRTTYVLEESVTAFKPIVDSVKTRPLNPKKQITVGLKLLSNPLKGSGVFVINSFPSDLRAKIFASCVMSSACEQHRDMAPTKRKGKSAPVWARLMGNGDFNQINHLREMRPSMLILSNINETASNSKLERLRDIIDAFDDIPRIVVTAGQDPITFMMKRVQYPLSGVMRLGSNEKINLLDM